MRKLTLDVETLAVESFATDAAAAARGTIAAHGYEATPLCIQTLPVNDCFTQNTFQNCWREQLFREWRSDEEAQARP